MSALWIRHKPEQVTPDYQRTFVAFPIMYDDAKMLRIGDFYDMGRIREGLATVPELLPAEVDYVRERASAAGYDVEVQS